MTFTIKISNGKTEVDFLLDGSYSLTEGGLNLSSTKSKKTASAPLVGSHGTKYSSVDYQNRAVSLTFSVYGSSYATLMSNVNTVSKLIQEANTGGEVNLILQTQDSSTSYLKIIGGEIVIPQQMFSMEGVHWKEGDTYVLHDFKLSLETAPFFTDYASYENEIDVARVVDTTVDNGASVSITDIAGDITTETILEFVGKYSSGTQKIYIGTGTHALETNLTVGIDDSETEITVDEDYTGKLLVPFAVDVESEELEIIAIEAGAWTVVRGYNSSTPAAHVATTAVTVQTLYDLDADSGLSHCTTASMRTGLIDSMSINTNGTGYVVNQIFTLTGDGDANAKARILSVSDTGAIVTWEITDAGSGYTASDTNVSINNGIATFDIDAIANVSETDTASTSDDLGSSYMEITVFGQGTQDLVEWTLDRHYVSTINQRCRVVGREASTGSAWNTSINYRVKIGYRTEEDSSFIEMDKTDWKTPNAQTDALFDFGSIMMPPSGSTNSAPDVTVILQVQIKPDDVYDSVDTIIEYTLDLDFIKFIPIGNGFRYINCGPVPFFILDKLIDDSRKIAPYVQEYTSSFRGDVTVDGIMPPVRLVPTNSGNSLHFLFEDGAGTANMTMTLDVEVGVVGNYLGLVI